MALSSVEDYLRFLPTVKQAPGHSLWFSYDVEADTLYINFRKPSQATDSELTDEDIIIRYADDEIIGVTILNASKRSNPSETTP